MQETLLDWTVPYRTGRKLLNLTAEQTLWWMGTSNARSLAVHGTRAQAEPRLAMLHLLEKYPVLDAFTAPEAGECRIGKFEDCGTVEDEDVLAMATAPPSRFRAMALGLPVCKKSQGSLHKCEVQ